MTGLGISPWIGTCVRRRRGFGWGTESSKARVYGSVGRRKMVSYWANSTIRPKYLIATESEMYSTTERSWEMNR